MSFKLSFSFWSPWRRCTNGTLWFLLLFSWILIFSQFKCATRTLVKKLSHFFCCDMATELQDGASVQNLQVAVGRGHIPFTGNFVSRRVARVSRKISKLNNYYGMINYKCQFWFSQLDRLHVLHPAATTAQWVQVWSWVPESFRSKLSSALHMPCLQADFLALVSNMAHCGLCDHNFHSNV